jgi:hypothetical protein
MAAKVYPERSIHHHNENINHQMEEQVVITKKALQQLEKLADTLIDRIKTLHAAGMFEVNGMIKPYVTLITPAEALKDLVANANAQVRADENQTVEKSHPESNDTSLAESSSLVLIIQLPPSSDFLKTRQSTCGVQGLRP